MEMTCLRKLHMLQNNWSVLRVKFVLDSITRITQNIKCADIPKRLNLRSLAAVLDYSILSERQPFGLSSENIIIWE